MQFLAKSPFCGLRVCKMVLKINVKELVTLTERNIYFFVRVYLQIIYGEVKMEAIVSSHMISKGQEWCGWNIFYSK
jgi:hypothetical protein